MTDREKLIDLGPEVLADTLLELAQYSEKVENRIELLMAEPKENIQRFKKKLAGIKHSTRFIDWRESTGFARDLDFLLEDLKISVEDPLTGIKLVASFYEADEKIFERCDDSNGCIGDVFRFTAPSVFSEFASRCEDKAKVAEIILKVNQEDPYGIRDSLVHGAGDFLPEDILRSMIDKLQQADEEGDSHFSLLIESLARQVKDPQLFERTRIASWGKPSTAANIDIARVYLESGDIETAHSWLKKIPEKETFKAYERDKLLKEIYQKQGDREKLSELLYKNFRSNHSTERLQELLDVVGQDRRDEILQKEIEQIKKAQQLQLADLQFLLSLGEIDEAERYLLDRSEQLYGGDYYNLPDLAKVMEAENRFLASSLIYRSLLLSILERAYTKAYVYGVRYLKKLDGLSKDIDNWKNFHTHDDFKKQLLEKHGRKRSFWSKYKG